MIMGKKSTERLMTLPELAEMLGVPIERCPAGGTEAKDRLGIESAVMSATAARQLSNGWRPQPTVATRWVGKTVA